MRSFEEITKDLPLSKEMNLLTGTALGAELLNEELEDQRHTPLCECEEPTCWGQCGGGMLPPKEVKR